MTAAWTIAPSRAEATAQPSDQGEELGGCRVDHCACVDEIPPRELEALMAIRRNPPHDRVFLSSEERREFARLVHTFIGRHFALEAGTRRGRLQSLRYRSAAALVAVARRRWWLISVGVVLLLAALVPPVLLVIVGVTTASLGAASGIVARWARARCVICRVRRG